jgi:putative transposase
MTSPRRPLPGHALHVIRRGVLRRRCFFEASDYLAYLEALTLHVPASGCALHAYVLMPNHVHMLLTPRRVESAQALMTALASPLWEHRYEAWPVHPARYLLGCMRYIEMNPVRAGLDLRAGDYPWSSYGANALGDANPLITPHSAYCALGRSPPERRAAYRRLYAPRTVSMMRRASFGSSSPRQAT